MAANSCACPRRQEAFVTVTHETAARVISSHFENHRVDAEVEADEPFIVVLSQTFFHPWHACVDGQPTRLLRANYAFQALQVPGGRHHIRLAYQDRAFYAGAVLSVVAILGCLGWRLARSKHPTAREDPSTKIQIAGPLLGWKLEFESSLDLGC